MKLELSVIIPVYNEVEHISAMVNETIKVLDSMGLTYEIIVTNDGSTDGTEEELGQLTSKNVKVISYKMNRGKGFAVRTGVAEATGSLVAFIDGDLEIHPKHLTLMVQAIKATQADVIVGSKYLIPSMVKMSMVRGFVSHVYKTFVSILMRLPISDTQTGIKIFRAESIKEILPLMTIDGYSFDVELLGLLQWRGYKIEEIPMQLQLNGRREKIRVSDAFIMLVDTISIRRRINHIKKVSGEKIIREESLSAARE